MKIISKAFVILFIFTIIFSANVYANSETNNFMTTQTESLGVSDLFVNFTDNALSDIDALSITDSDGNDVTMKYVERFTEYHSRKDYKSIQQLIELDGLNVSYVVREVVASLRPDVNPFAIRTERFTQQFYHIANDLDGRFGNKEWVTTLSGTAQYDPNTGRIISATSPTITFDTYFGAAFDTDPKNISTGYKINTSSIDFYGSYRMTAILGIPIGDFSIGFELDYGYFEDKFTAYPEF